MEKKEPKIRNRLRWQRKIVNAEERNNRNKWGENMVKI